MAAKAVGISMGLSNNKYPAEGAKQKSPGFPLPSLNLDFIGQKTHVQGRQHLFEGGGGQDKVICLDRFQILDLLGAENRPRLFNQRLTMRQQFEYTEQQEGNQGVSWTGQGWNFFRLCFDSVGWGYTDRKPWVWLWRN